MTSALRRLRFSAFAALLGLAVSLSPALAQLGPGGGGGGDCGTAGGIGYFPTTGTTIGCSSGITASNSALTLNSTIVWSGPATNPTALQPFSVLENLSGTSTAPGGSLLNQNSIEITDNLNTGAENSLAQGFFVYQKVGTSAYGSRQALVGQIAVGTTTDSNPGSALPGYVGTTSVVIAAGNVGGTGLTYATAS